MAQQWFYARGGQKAGPITSKQLREMAAAGGLRPTDLVWTEGMEQWKEARLVKGLFASAQADAHASADQRSDGPTAADGQVDSSLALDRLRERLTQHARSIPHHGLGELGAEIEVRKGYRIPIYRIDWTTLFERRDVVPRQVPQDGSRSVPPPAVHPENLDPWKLQLPPAIDFKGGSSEFPVPGSESIQGCAECRANGVVCCDSCQGQRSVRCGHCGGGGWVQCAACSGMGQTVQFRAVQRTRVCSNVGRLAKAHGTGAFGTGGTCRGGWNEYGNPCHKCNGTGVEHYISNEMYQAPCLACSARGQHPCQSCGGGGAVCCSRCGGHGGITCPVCQGHQRMLHYLAVIRTNETREESATTPALDCPAEAIRGLDPGSDFRKALTRSCQDAQIDLTLDRKFIPLIRLIRELRDKLHAHSTGHLRRVGDRLTVSEAHVVRLEYTFAGKVYIAWFPGEEGPIYAPISPVTDSVLRLIEEAMTSWDSGRQNEAVEAIRRILAMSKRSPECGAVWHAEEHRLPEELKRRASKFSVLFWMHGFGLRAKMLKFFYNDRNESESSHKVGHYSVGGFHDKPWIVRLLAGLGFASLGFLIWGLNAQAIWTMLGLRGDDVQAAIITVGYIAVIFAAVAVARWLPLAEMAAHGPPVVGQSSANRWLIGVLTGVGSGSICFIASIVLLRNLESALGRELSSLIIPAVLANALVAGFVGLRIARAVPPVKGPSIEEIGGVGASPVPPPGTRKGAPDGPGSLATPLFETDRSA